jgi:hypothetical protein
MEFWRRWRLLSVIALVGALSPVALGADLATLVAGLKDAKGSAAVDAREAIVSPTKSMTLMSRATYGTKVATSLAPLLVYTTNVDAQLNAAIAIAELHTLSMDSSLEGMLKNTSPAVRYWGAKGLGGIMPDLQNVGGATINNAVNALLAALKTEKSGIVKARIMEALGKTNDVKTVQQGVDILAAQISAKTTDAETLDAAATGLAQFDAAIRASASGMSKADASAAAKSVAWTASFVAQQQVALNEKLSADQSDLPEGYAASTANVVNTAVKVLNDLAGRGTFKAPAGDESPDALQLLVDGITGTPSTGQGELQKVMPDVPVPPVIKK